MFYSDVIKRIAKVSIINYNITIIINTLNFVGIISNRYLGIR